MPHIYGLDSASEELVGVAAKIAKDVAKKHAADVDAKGRFPSEAIEALASAGFNGLTLPKDVGGLGQGPRAFCAVAEELGAACASTAMVWVMHTASTQLLLASPTLGGKSALLREIASGKHLTTLAATEAGSRSNFWYQVSELAPDGDGCKVSCVKRFVTSSGHADSFVAQSRRPGAQNPADLTLYLVRSKAPGVKVKGGFDGLGLRGNESSPIELEGYRIPKDDLLSAHGEGNPLGLMVILPWFNIGTAAMSHGLCLAVLEATSGHMQNTGFAHDDTKLRDLPTLRARLAEMTVRTNQSRALLGHTLAHLEQPSDVTPLFVLQCRHAAINAAVDVTDLAMKACGGAAFARQLGVERSFRDARAGWVMSPTSDALADFVGKALTGLPLM